MMTLDQIVEQLRGRNPISVRRATGRAILTFETPAQARRAYFSALRLGAADAVCGGNTIVVFAPDAEREDAENGEGT